MANVERTDKSSIYSNKELLELLSLYEGELQARDALLDLYQQQSLSASQLQLSTALLPSASSSSQCSSAATPPSSTSSSACHNALSRDAQLTRVEHHAAGSECAMCGNALFHGAKLMQRQQIWERKVAKMLHLLKKHYSEGQQELDGRQRQMQLMAKENGQYVKNLETERDQLLEELTKCKTELVELFEQRVNIEEQLEGERDRTRLMILHLVKERKQMVDEARKHQQKQKQMEEERAKKVAQNAPIHHRVPNALSSIGCGGAESVDVQMGLLRGENARLLATVSSLQAEKVALKKRLDQLLCNHQQQRSVSVTSPEQQQHQQSNFLMQSKTSPTRKEQQLHQQQKLISLRDNGFIVGPLPHKPQQQQPFFPPLASSAPALPSFSPAASPSSSAPSTTAISSSSSHHSFSTIPPRPPTIRPSASFPLHLGSSTSTSSVPHLSDVGDGKKQRPTTAPEGANRRTSGRTTIATKGTPNQQQQRQQHTHQFPVTDSDWVRTALLSPPVTTDHHHRVIVPLMGTHSANFSRSSVARPPPPAPVPRTSVATIPRSPQHRRTTMGATIEQHIGAAGQGQQQHQQTRVAIARRSSSLPRRMMSGVPGAASATPPLPPQQFHSPNPVPHHHHHHRQQQPNPQHHNFHPSVSGEQFIYQQPNNGLVGGDTHSHFL